MAAAVPSISCCVLNHHNLFYQIQNALAFNRDTCCHVYGCFLSTTKKFYSAGPRYNNYVLKDCIDLRAPPLNGYTSLGRRTFSRLTFGQHIIWWIVSTNGMEAAVNRALVGSTYCSLKLVHSVFGKLNYGGLKHNSLYLGLVLPSGG